jgi:hypothetical protein
MNENEHGCPREPQSTHMSGDICSGDTFLRNRYLSVVGGLGIFTSLEIIALELHSKAI